MSDSESIDYLQPGFDPASLTNPRLRSILVTYNVHYPSNAKKPDLVELFNSHVAPQANKILARRARAKRSSMGIVDAGGDSQSTIVASSFDAPPPPSATGRRSYRARSTTPYDNGPDYGRGAGNEDGDGGDNDDDERGATPVPSRQSMRQSSPRKRQSRSASYRSSVAPTTASDTDTGADSVAHASSNAGRSSRPASSRRTRAKTPQVKLEPTDEEVFFQAPSLSAAHKTPQQTAASRRSVSAAASADDDNITFTDDNPFQSGSSPLAPTASTSFSSASTLVAKGGAHRSKASARGPSLTSAKRLSGASQKTPLASASFQSWEDQERRSPTVEDLLAPGEEFTHDEQLQLELEQAASRQRSSAANDRWAKKVPQSASTGQHRRGRGGLRSAVWVLLLTLLSAYAAWYRQEQIAVGFCGLGRPAVPLFVGALDRVLDSLPDRVSDSLPDAVVDWTRKVDRMLSDVDLPPRLALLAEPQCVPCPPHAVCFSDFSVRCENGYMLKAHPLALGGLVPLAPTCQPDGEHARRVKAVADKAVEALRDRRAKYECGELTAEDDAVQTAAADDDQDDSDAVVHGDQALPRQPRRTTPVDASLEVNVLKDVISAKRSKKMSKEEFDDLWTAALGDIEARDEVEVQTDAAYPTSGARGLSNTRLSSTSLARLPLTCAIRRSIRLGVARYRFPLSILVLAVLAAAYARARYLARRATLARVPALVDLVLERLAAQKELWLYEADEEVGSGGGGVGDSDDEAAAAGVDPFLFLPHLRDDVLRTTHSLAARKRIWAHVCTVVEQNSNVRTGQREGRNGEVGRAWEWIGPVGTTSLAAPTGSSRASEVAMSGILPGRRRRSGRASWGGSRSGTPRESSLGVGAAATAGGGGGGDDSYNSSGLAGSGISARTAGSGSLGGDHQPFEMAEAKENRSNLHRRWQESRPIY